jgi:hypothetical protein
MYQNPIWALEFRKQIKKFKRAVGGSDIYKKQQSDLSELFRIGRGNCVAMSKLFRKILKGHSIPYQHMIIGESDTRRSTHQITLVYESNNYIWLQSNDILRRFKNFSSLIKYAENEMKWKSKGMKVVEVKYPPY